ncbi:hypothetical protein KRX51_07610 [Corynebacterium sp. TAE3-ERU12]|uniref:hypothetical protein n=1 Tax=Corynebacterium sp. TAE3-ERU12 TaxID=2849491 RepID=UPI001C48C049|nr:hypothetical protein [Corynebacterium sp. TAE3-ERU12]MBV7295780.1 hypothetical protein [Corynebacterium sp. TAE3-ERU12]
MSNAAHLPWTWSAGSITDARGRTIAEPAQWSVMASGRTLTITGPKGQWRATPRGLTTSAMRLSGDNGQLIMERQLMGFGRSVRAAGTAVAHTKVPRDGRVILEAQGSPAVAEDLLIAALLSCGYLDGPGVLKG